MGQCNGCGRHMSYGEFEKHLQESKRCWKIVMRLRERQKKRKEELK